MGIQHGCKITPWHNQKTFWWIDWDEAFYGLFIPTEDGLLIRVLEELFLCIMDEGHIIVREDFFQVIGFLEMAFMLICSEFVGARPTIIVYIEISLLCSMQINLLAIDGTSYK